MSATRLRNADDLTPAELASAAIDTDLVLEREPLLSDNGFKQLRRRRPRTEHDAEFIRWRDDMRAPRSLAQFMAARGWLRRFSKIKALNRRGTSYGLKHCAEDDISYVTNGVFIAAAIAEGFVVRCAEFGSPNAWFNISTEAWRHVERNRAEQRRRALIEQWRRARWCAMTDDGPICAYCKRGTDERRLVSVYVRMSEGRRFYAHEACARRNDAKSLPPDPLFNRRRPIPTLSERLDQWNSLADELIDLFEEYQSAPRVKATMEAACDVFNGISWRATDMTWALGDPRQDRPDEAGDQVRTLRWHLDRFRAAIKRDPTLRGKRGDPTFRRNLDGIVAGAPDLRLPDTLEKVLNGYRRGLRGLRVWEASEAAS